MKKQINFTLFAFVAIFSLFVVGCNNSQNGDKATSPSSHSDANGDITALNITVVRTIKVGDEELDPETCISSNSCFCESGSGHYVTIYFKLDNQTDPLVTSANIAFKINDTENVPALTASNLTSGINSTTFNTVKVNFPDSITSLKVNINSYGPQTFTPCQ